MSLAGNGFEIHRGSVDRDTLDELLKLLPTAQGAGSRSVGQIGAIIAFANSPRLTSLLPTKGMRLVRSLFFDKTPSANWPVAWHQDLTIQTKERREVSGYGPWTNKAGIPHVQPPTAVLQSMVTLRVHLDPTPPENGALLVIPGSHKHGILTPEGVKQQSQMPRAVVACEAGDLLAMRPLLLHSSRRATHPSHRRILHFEYANPETLSDKLEWRTMEADLSKPS